MARCALAKDTYKKARPSSVFALNLEVGRAFYMDTYTETIGTSLSVGYKSSESGNATIKDGTSMSECLTIYDPRFTDRTFQTATGIWSSMKNGVVFFETDIYSVYTDTAFVGTLLRVLVSESRSGALGLRVSKRPIER